MSPARTASCLLSSSVPPPLPHRTEVPESPQLQVLMFESKSLSRCCSCVWSRPLGAHALCWDWANWGLAFSCVCLLQGHKQTLAEWPRPDCCQTKNLPGASCPLASGAPGSWQQGGGRDCWREERGRAWPPELWLVLTLPVVTLVAGTLTQNEMVFKRLHLGTVSYGTDTMDEIQSHVASSYSQVNGCQVRCAS